MDVTRRTLARSLTKMLAVAAAVPQKGISQAPLPANADLESARELMKTNAAAIAKIKLPMATEPPFHFKA